MFTVTKSYRDLPAAHRQPKHDGHCRQIHGHNWAFDITFTCDKLDKNGFVIDVGQLHKVKEFLTCRFDHTLLLNTDDPLWDEIGDAWNDIADLVGVPNCGMEGLAEYVCKEVSNLIDSEDFRDAFDRGLKVVQVRCWEDSKNSATYIPIGI